MDRRGGPESKVINAREREGFAWAADQAIILWTERRRLAIATLNRREMVRAKWNLRRATRLLERLRPSAKPCTRCRQWKPIGAFYWHEGQGKHDARCADCCRAIANARYRGRNRKVLKREAAVIQEKLMEATNAKNSI